MKSELFEKAESMLKFSYSPYSHFCVGAALLCADGTIYTGCFLLSVYLLIPNIYLTLFFQSVTI